MGLLYLPYSFLLEAESTPAPYCGRKDYVTTYIYIFLQLRCFGNSFELSDYNCFVNMLFRCHSECNVYLLLAEIQWALCAYKNVCLMFVLLCKLETEDIEAWMKHILSLSTAKHTFCLNYDENNSPICNYVLWHTRNFCFSTNLISSTTAVWHRRISLPNVGLYNKGKLRSF
jgi:hypothetical protein